MALQHYDDRECDRKSDWEGIAGKTGKQGVSAKERKNRKFPKKKGRVSDISIGTQGLKGWV